MVTHVKNRLLGDAVDGVPFNDVQEIPQLISIRKVESSPMKTPQVLSFMVVAAAFPCWAQTSPSSTAAPSNPATSPAPDGAGNRQEMLRKLEGMTPDQRQEFLLNHPKLQQFIDNHPKLEQKLANGSEAGAGIKDPGHPRVNEVNQREENQQDRIAQGVSNGTLFPQEAAKLEKGESRIQQQEAQDLQKNNGHLTPAEQAKLNSEENRLSHRIHHEKHEK